LHKRLRIFIPAVQLAAAFVVFSANRFYGGTRFYGYYLGDAEDVIIHLNLPLVALWTLVFSPIAWVTRYLPPVTGTLHAVGTILVALLLVSSAALFWYLVAVEIEMRSRGESMLRPSGWYSGLAAVAGLCCFGAGAAFYGYVVSRPLWYARPVDAVIEGSLPAIWGLVFIGIAAQDLVVSMRNRTKRLAERST
jgi:hypothetical protein